MISFSNLVVDLEGSVWIKISIEEKHKKAIALIVEKFQDASIAGLVSRLFNMGLMQIAIEMKNPHLIESVNSFIKTLTK